MITQEQFQKWAEEKNIEVTPIEDGIKSGIINMCLIDGILRVDWIDEGWDEDDEYGEVGDFTDIFTTIEEFNDRWDDVHENGV